MRDAPQRQRREIGERLSGSPLLKLAGASGTPKHRDDLQVDPAPARPASLLAAARERDRHRRRHPRGRAPAPRRRRRSRCALAIGPQRLRGEGQPERSARSATSAIQDLVQRLFLRLPLELSEEVLLQGLTGRCRPLAQSVVNLWWNVLDLDTWHISQCSASMAPLQEFWRGVEILSCLAQKQLGFFELSLRQGRGPRAVRGARAAVGFNASQHLPRIDSESGLCHTQTPWNPSAFHARQALS